MKHEAYLLSAIGILCQRRTSKAQQFEAKTCPSMGLYSTSHHVADIPLSLRDIPHHY